MLTLDESGAKMGIDGKLWINVGISKLFCGKAFLRITKHPARITNINELRIKRFVSESADSYIRTTLSVDSYPKPKIRKFVYCFRYIRSRLPKFVNSYLAIGKFVYQFRYVFRRIHIQNRR